MLLHSSLLHPCLVSVLSIFVSSGVHHCVVDLCIHGTLEEILVARGPRQVTEDELRGLLKGLADALVYLASEAVVHRSINPASILLDGKLRVVRSILSRVTGFDGGPLETLSFRFSGTDHARVKHIARSMRSAELSIAVRIQSIFRFDG